MFSGASWTTMHKVYVQFWSESIKTTLNNIFSVQCCLKPLGQHFTRFLPGQCCLKSINETLQGSFPVQCCLESLGQQSTRFLLVQYCLDSIKRTLKKICSCALLSEVSMTTFLMVLTCAILSQEY